MKKYSCANGHQFNDEDIKEWRREMAICPYCCPNGDPMRQVIIDEMQKKADELMAASHKPRWAEKNYDDWIEDFNERLSGMELELKIVSRINTDLQIKIDQLEEKILALENCLISKHDLDEDFVIEKTPRIMNDDAFNALMRMGRQTVD